MNLLWYSYIFFINISFIKLQTIDIDINIINESSTISETDNFILKTPHITILGALTNTEHIKILNSTTIYSNKDLLISSESFIINSNALSTMLDLCNIGNNSRAKIILVDYSNDDNLTLTAISYVSDFYHIPVLTIAARENMLSDHVNNKKKKENKLKE